MSFETEILASQALKTKDPERAVQIVNSYNNGSSSFESAMKDLNSLNSKKGKSEDLSKQQRIDVNKKLSSMHTIHSKTKSKELKSFDTFSRKMGVLDRSIKGERDTNLSRRLNNFFYSVTKEYWIGSPKDNRDKMIMKELGAKSIDEAYRIVGEAYQKEMKKIVEDYFKENKKINQEDRVSEYESKGLNFLRMQPIGYKKQKEKISDIKQKLSKQKAEVTRYEKSRQK